MAAFFFERLLSGFAAQALSGFRAAALPCT